MKLVIKLPLHIIQKNRLLFNVLIPSARVHEKALDFQIAMITKTQY